MASLDWINGKGDLTGTYTNVAGGWQRQGGGSMVQGSAKWNQDPNTGQPDSDYIYSNVDNATQTHYQYGHGGGSNTGCFDAFPSDFDSLVSLKWEAYWQVSLAENDTHSLTVKLVYGNGSTKTDVTTASTIFSGQTSNGSGLASGTFTLAGGATSLTKADLDTMGVELAATHSRSMSADNSWIQLHALRVGGVYNTSGTTADAETISATGTAYTAAAVTVAPVSETIAGTGTADNVAADVAPTSETISATGSAYDATVDIPTGTSAPAEEASGTGTAYDVAAVKVATSVETASATGTAYDAIVSLDTNAPAGTISATGVASDPTVDVDVSAETISSTGTAHDGSVTFTGTADAEQIASTATSWDATVTRTGNALAGTISSSGVAYDAVANTAVLVQEGFRFRTDSGNESTPTWEAAQDTNVSIDVGTTIGLRVLIDSTDDPTSGTFSLQHRLVGGTWVDVDVDD